jgi:DNA-binding MarR family transcriptional regulator
MNAAAGTWTFLTNHAHVLLCIAQDPGIRLRDVADRVGITERAAQRIVADLEQGGYLDRRKTGRRNHYELHPEIHLRHPIEDHLEVGVLLELLAGSRSRA